MALIYSYFYYLKKVLRLRSPPLLVHRMTAQISEKNIKTSMEKRYKAAKLNWSVTLRLFTTEAVRLKKHRQSFTSDYLQNCLWLNVPIGVEHLLNVK